MRRAIFVAVLLLPARSALAEPVPLGGDALKQTLAGKTIHLDTPLGIAVPITFHGNGLMSGKAGVLSYILGADNDRGRWWTEEGKLCQRWFKWLDAKPSCMRVQQDGEKIFWRRDDGVSGTATIVAGLPPGAESAPRGLGGPPQPLQASHSLMASEEPDRVKLASLAAAAAAAPAPVLHREPKPAQPRAVAAVAPPQPPPLPQQAAAAGPAAPSPGDYQILAAKELVAGAGQDDRWCHPDLPGATEANAAPDLVFVARLSYAGAEPQSPANACLTALPPLRHVATLGIEAR